MRLTVVIAAFGASVAQAGGPTGDDALIAGMQLGKHTLQDVLTHFGIAPLRNGDIDELCYRSETPLEATWLVFGSGANGDYERLTQFRVMSSPPSGLSCPPSARITRDIATASGIRIGMPVDELNTRLGPHLRITADNGRLTSYEVRLIGQR